MKINRVTVAKKAGVSVSTVSYVLNSSRYVSPKSVEKVLNAVEELGYSPDMAARSMVKKRSQILTIIANDLINSMYGEILVEIEKEAVKRGYIINMCTGLLPLKEYVKSMIGRRVDGVYFASVPEKVSVDDIEKLLNNDVAIACGNYLLFDEKRINRVEVDYADGIKQAVKYLKELGHTEIVYLNGVKKGDKDVKCESFIKNMKEFGLNPNIIYGFGAGQLTDKEGKILAKKLLEEYPETTAILCYSDSMAYGTLQALHEKGKKVPQDVSVIGVENQITSKFTNPPLTTLSFDRTEFACAVVDALLGEIENGELSDKLVKMELCVRESAQKPKR